MIVSSDWSARFQSPVDMEMVNCKFHLDQWAIVLDMPAHEPLCVDCLAERIIDAYLASIPFMETGEMSKRMTAAIRASKERAVFPPPCQCGHSHHEHDADWRCEKCECREFVQ